MKKKVKQNDDTQTTSRIGFMCLSKGRQENPDQFEVVWVYLCQRYNPYWIIAFDIKFILLSFQKKHF